MERSAVAGIGVVAGLVFGGIAGWMLGGGQTGTAPPAPGDPPPAAGPAATGDAGMPAAAAGIRAAGFGASAAALLGEVPEDIHPAPAADLPAGTISGSIFTGEGRPIEGAVVRATFHESGGEEADSGPRTWRMGDGAPDEADLRTKVRAFIESETKTLAARRETKTDVNGNYVLAGIGPGSWYVEAYARGHVLDIVDRNGGFGVRAGSRIDFAGTPVVRVAVDVRLPDGTRPAHAVFRQAQGSLGGAITDEHWHPSSPEIRLTPGAFVLQAFAGPKDLYRSENVHVAVEAGTPPPPLTIPLRMRTGIRGRITFPEPDCVEGAVVHLRRRVPGGDDGDDDAKLLEDGMAFCVDAEDSPEFSFYDLASGEWRLGISTGARGIVHRETVTLIEGTMLARDLEVPAADETRGVVVRVLAPDGSLIRGASVEVVPDPVPGTGVRPHRRSPTESGGWSVTRSPDGTSRAVWTGGAPDGTEGPATIRASAPGFGSRSVPCPAGGTGTVDVRMQKPGTLEVAVSGLPARPPDRSLWMQLHASRSGGQGIEHFGRSEIHDGICTFGPLQPGDYELSLLTRHMIHCGRSSSAATVRIVSGRNRSTVALPPLHALSIDFGDDRDQRHISLRRTDDASESWFGGNHADGLLVFADLPAGEYEVRRWSPAGQESMRIRVPAPGVVRFQAEPELALLVKERDAEGYLESAGIRAGDLITGVNGEPFGGERPASSVVSGLMTARTENSLLIHRDGRTLEIKVDAARFLDATMHGQTLVRPSR